MIYNCIASFIGCVIGCIIGNKIADKTLNRKGGCCCGQHQTATTTDREGNE